ncbi:hypothetical protein E2C01_022367 [Portunus trituberculatus]|uniref:Uncharacterized protein n=1 Tax=Portunus trituberculatus TaxID=210409 RepID=A0A5B7E737_PORTR|nr:hypothetical protein [Portunus trituberculatus]
MELDNISPHLLKGGAKQLPVPPATIFKRISPPGAKDGQVTFAPEKTQAVLIYISQDSASPDQLTILMEGRRVHLHESVSILGVDFDSGLIFTSCVRKVDMV